MLTMHRAACGGRRCCTSRLLDKRDPKVSEAMIRWTAINTITRRIARGGPATRQKRRTLAATS